MTARLSASLVVAWLAAGILAAGQQPAPPVPPATGTGLIIGRLADSQDGTPVTGALVTLNGPASKKVIVDTRGRFVFTDLLPGAYTLTATKTRYLAGSFGKRRPDGDGRTLDLPANGQVTDAVITMWRSGVISGSVTDDTGEPMPVRVQAFRRTIVAGRPRLVAGVFASTDDRGVYRFSSLTPGDYLIATMTYTISAPVAAASMVDAARRAGGSTAAGFMQQAQINGASSPLLDMFNLNNGMQRRGDLLVMTGAGTPVPTGAADRPLMHFSSVWYPAAAGPTSATTVTVGPGDERLGVDLQLRLSPSVTVSGVVTGPEGPIANLGLRLVPAGLDEISNETTIFSGLTASSADGSFAFAGVSPGQYTIRAATMPRMGAYSLQPRTDASSSMLWVATSVNVGDADVSGVRAVARTGAKLSGRFAFDGSATHPTAAELKTAAGLVAEPADGRAVVPGPVYLLQVEVSDGSIWSPGLPAGRYFIRASGNLKGWTLKSVTARGRDVAETPLVIDAEDVTDLVVTFTDHPSGFSGTVRTQQGNADLDAVVLIFPADPALWRDTGATPRTLRSARPGRTGAFSTSGLPPGDYLAVAIPDADARGWQDPARLQALSRSASRVHVEDGQNASASLTTVVIR